MTYTTAHCQMMIRHYQAQMSNWTKPARWHALAAMSVATWQHKLAEALAAEAA